MTIPNNNKQTQVMGVHKSKFWRVIWDDAIAESVTLPCTGEPDVPYAEWLPPRQGVYHSVNGTLPGQGFGILGLGSFPLLRP